mgnify:CR=1 FL=1
MRMKNNSAQATKVITAHVPLLMADKVDQMAARLERSRGWVIKQALCWRVRNPLRTYWPDYLCIAPVAHTRKQVDYVWGQL